MRRQFSRHLLYLSLGLLFGCSTTYRPEPLNEPQILEELKSPPPAEGLTLAQLQSLALVRHPALRKIRAERGFVEAARIRADNKPDPEISLSPFWIVPAAMLGVVASLRWEILPPGTRDARRGLAGALQETTDAKIATEEWRVAQEIRIAWIEHARSEELLKVAQQRVELSREARDFGRSMLSRGALTETEASILELELAEAERDFIEVRETLSLTRKQLCESAGLPADSPVAFVQEPGLLEVSEAKTPQGNSDQELMRRLPQLREARHRYRLAERELELSCLGSQPKIAAGPDLQRDDSNTFVGAGATVTVPLTDANRAAIAEATTQREIAARHFEEQLFSARAHLAKALAEKQVAFESLQMHVTKVAPLAKQTLANAQKEFDAGVTNFLSLLIARERALKAERTGLELQIAHSLAVARLEAAFGPESISNSGESQ